MNWFLALPHSLQATVVLTVFASVALLGARALKVATLHGIAVLAPLLAAAPAALQPTPESFAVLAVLSLALLCGLLLRAEDLEHAEHRAECTALVLLGAAGACVLATSDNLLSILIGFETMSLSVAVMAGLGRGTRSLEAAFKFFVLAAASVATLVYGLGLYAYATGSFTLGAAAQSQGLQELQSAGLLLMCLGIAFELALVPMHFGALGVYFATPMGCTGFAMTISKAGAVMALSRLTACHEQLQPLLVGLGVLSISWATFAGLAQRHLRGMLAYSAVAHGGFLALAIGCGDDGRKAALYYALIYVASAALVVAAMAGRSGDLPLATLRERPLGALRTGALVAGLLSLAGVPPSPGFWAKLAVLGPSWHQAGPVLTSVAVLGGVFGALYYLRPLPDLLAHLRAGGDEPADPPGPRIALVLAGSVCAVFVVLPNLALWMTS